MLIVTALGGNALLRRHEELTAENQRANVRIACEALAGIADENQLVITHGNGPQVGLLDLQQTAEGSLRSYPFDVLGAETEGMSGYMIEVDPADPAFAEPAKFIGPTYPKMDADRLAAERGWTFKQDGLHWRRVVASPDPKRIFELRPIKWLLEQNTIVIAAGGGGIPTMYQPGKDRKLVGVECVIDKDLASELLAKELSADMLVMLTDADAVYADWGTPHQRAIRVASPVAMRTLDFPAGSMGPKVDAACRFASATGKKAAIGSMEDLGRIIKGEAGTTVSEGVDGIVYA